MVKMYYAKSCEEAARARESRLSPIISEMRRGTEKAIDDYEGEHLQMKKVVSRMRSEQGNSNELGSDKRLAIYSCDPSLIPAWTDEDVKRLDRAVSHLREILKE